MIRNFRHKGLKDFFETGTTKGIIPQQADRIALCLDVMDVADDLEELDQPGWNLHELKGKRKGTWSIHINGPWCITFGFEDGDCVDIDYEQYH